MSVLRDSTWQFVITTSTTIVISIITSVITVWLARRIPVELPIGYETLETKIIQSDENIKAIKEKMHLLLNGSTSNSLCLFAFRIWNNGKKPIQLSNPTPLIVRFNQGTKVIGWDELERKPDYVKMGVTIEDREVRLELPFLDAKQEISIQLLLNKYIDYFPDVYAEVQHNGRNKFMKANNIQSSRENSVAGSIFIGMSILFLISYYSSWGAFVDKLYPLIVVFGGYFTVGMVFLYMSHIERRSVPHHRLLSKRIKEEFKLFLSVLPGLIFTVAIAIGIYFFFGEKVLTNCIVTFVFIVFPASLCISIYYIAKWILKKLQASYVSMVIIFLIGIVPTVIIVREVPLLIYVWTR